MRAAALCIAVLVKLRGRLRQASKMVWQTLGLFKSLIYYESVIIDDFIFRFHYSFTSYMLLFASLLVTGKVTLWAKFAFQHEMNSF